jgi:hypothetical protein
MLKAIPKGWFTPDFTVLQDGTPVADIDLSLWREAADLQIQGMTCKMYREGLVSGSFLLEAGGEVLARADKPSALFRSLEVEHRGARYILEAESALMRKFVLKEGEREVGSIYPEHAFTSRAVVDLPVEMPLAVQVFMLWLVVLMWKRGEAPVAVV